GYSRRERAAGLGVEQEQRISFGIMAGASRRVSWTACESKSVQPASGGLGATQQLERSRRANRFAGSDSRCNLSPMRQSQRVDDESAVAVARSIQFASIRERAGRLQSSTCGAGAD